MIPAASSLVTAVFGTERGRPGRCNVILFGAENGMARHDWNPGFAIFQPHMSSSLFSRPHTDSKR